MNCELVRDRISRETQMATLEMLEEANSGDVIGVAAVVMCTGRRFYVVAAGAARTDPYLAKGYMSELHSELDGIIKQTKEQQTL